MPSNFTFVFPQHSNIIQISKFRCSLILESENEKILVFDKLHNRFAVKAVKT